MDIEIDNFKFCFDCANLKNKQNNEKKEIIFNYQKNENSTYYFDVAYSEKGSKTNINDITKNIKIHTDIIEKAFATFKKQTNVDYFINKNARKFLSEQLDIYLHQVLLNENNEFELKRLNQYKTIKEYAMKIIEFVAEFEDELVRI